ncbi:MAG TPA: NAD(P)-binding domain-containing protein [Candidatus Limnocylindrales bacterium]|nr:NAD(P)-binding domain-containing protein [Candidatus Limnocylindrales bacterium]
MSALSVGIVALVAHARDVPSEAREAFGAELAELPPDPGRILIRTCHRVELYAVGPAADHDLAAIAPPPGVTPYADVEAVQHLIAVACGLDSAVFGETQILHQLREAVEHRRGEVDLDPVMDRLLQSALRAGREARSLLTGPPRSLADAALDRILPPLAAPAAGTHSPGALPAGAQRSPSATPEILVVGAGRMGRLAALAVRRRGASIRVASRSPERASALALDLGGASQPLSEAGTPTGVIVALAGPWPLSDAELDGLVQAAVPVVDLSSPPALTSDQRARLGARYVSVDDLAAADRDGPDARLRLRLDRLVSRAGGDFCQWLRSRDAVPAITAVVTGAEARRAEELAWLRRRLPDLSNDELATIDQMSHRLVAAILHAPLEALTRDDDGELEPAARTLFGL